MTRRRAATFALPPLVVFGCAALPAQHGNELPETWTVRHLAAVSSWAVDREHVAITPAFGLELLVESFLAQLDALARRRLGTLGRLHAADPALRADATTLASFAPELRTVLLDCTTGTVWAEPSLQRQLQGELFLDERLLRRGGDATQVRSPRLAAESATERAAARLLLGPAPPDEGTAAVRHGFSPAPHDVAGGEGTLAELRAAASAVCGAENEAWFASWIATNACAAGDEPSDDSLAARYPNEWAQPRGRCFSRKVALGVTGELHAFEALARAAAALSRGAVAIDRACEGAGQQDRAEHAATLIEGLLAAARRQQDGWAELDPALRRHADAAIQRSGRVRYDLSRAPLRLEPELAELRRGGRRVAAVRLQILAGTAQ